MRQVLLDKTSSLPTIEMVGYGKNKPVFAGCSVVQSAQADFALLIAYDFNRGVHHDKTRDKSVILSASEESRCSDGLRCFAIAQHDKKMPVILSGAKNLKGASLRSA